MDLELGTFEMDPELEEELETFEMDLELEV